MKLKKILGKFVSVAVVFVFVVSVYAQNQTVTVTGNTSPAENQPGWMFNRDPVNATPFEFNTDQASIGSGSLYVKPIGSIPAHKFIGENFINMAIADIDSISYDFLIGSGGTASDANQFYMNVYANFGVSPDDKFFDCRYEVIPTVGSTTNFTTVTFDPTQAYPVTQRNTSPFTCPAIPADMGEGATIRMFSLNVGDTSSSDAGLDGYLDKVVVSTTDGSTTYDFEPVLTPTSPDQCKKGGWMNFNTPVFKNQGDCVSSFNKNK